MSKKEKRAQSAREVAASVVCRTLRGQSFLSDALDEALAGTPLEPRDRALATELSYGVVRVRAALERRLSALTTRGAKRDPLVEAQLLVAAYQLLLLDRVPDFAAVNEAVATLRRLRGARVAAFGNAVLRRLATETERLDAAEARLESLPEWLSSELLESLGREATLALLGGGVAGPVPEVAADGEAGDADQRAGSGRAHRGLCVRLTARAEGPPAWLESSEPGRLCPGAFWLPPSGDPRKLEGHDAGLFVVQEEGAQWAARALGARPGERVLDACAGHGQKASLIAEQLGGDGALHVSDVSGDKLDELGRELSRLGLPQPTRYQLDLTTGVGKLPRDFDRVLVDAPCTGTGTLRRRPEIALRLEPSDAARLADQGVAIARNAAKLLRPGGRLVYVTCSVLRSECEAVVERIAATAGGNPALLEPVPFDAELARALAGDGSSVRLSPLEHGTDGYFVASFVRR